MLAGVNGTYVVTVGWCTGTAGGGSRPSVWEEPIADYKEAVASGIRQLERIYNDAERRSLTDKGELQPEVYPQAESRIAGVEAPLYRSAAVKFIFIPLPFL